MNEMFKNPTRHRTCLLSAQPSSHRWRGGFGPPITNRHLLQGKRLVSLGGFHR